MIHGRLRSFAGGLWPFASGLWSFASVLWLFVVVCVRLLVVCGGLRSFLVTTFLTSVSDIFSSKNLSSINSKYCRLNTNISIEAPVSFIYPLQ